MHVAIQQPVGEFVAAVNVPAAGEEEDAFLQGVVDDFQMTASGSQPVLSVRPLPPRSERAGHD